MASQGQISDILQATVSVFSVPIELEKHVRVALIVVGGASDASTALKEDLRAVFEDGVPANSDTEEDRRVEVESEENMDDWKSVVQKVLGCDAAVLVFNKKPPLTVRPLTLLTMQRRVSSTGVRVYFVDNFLPRTESGVTNPLDLLQHPRVRDLFQKVLKLTGEGDRSQLKRLAADVKEGLMSKDIDRKSYEGIGEAFAWNFAFTFLRLILPKLDECIRATLQVGNMLSQSKLNGNRIHVARENIIVVNKYFILVPEKLDQNIDMDKLFHGCEKKSLLKFEGLGYQRKVFVYLMDLSEDVAVHATHAIIFGDWASPVFAIKKMEQGQEVPETNEKIFQQFKVALKLILNHASFPKLLFSSGLDVGGDRPNWSSNVEVLEVSDGDSLRQRLEREVENCSRLTHDALPFAQLSIQTSTSEESEPHLLVKMGDSMDERDSSAVQNALQRNSKLRYKLLEPQESMSEYINKCDRILLVVRAQELRHADETEDIKLAAKKMNETGRCCVSAVIVGDIEVELEAIHQILPDRLKHLPYCCVASVRALSEGNVGGRLPYRLPHNNLNDLISGLRLDENCLSIEDVFPIMSMASVLTANICCGFVDKMEEHAREEFSEGRELPFDPPYFLVLPSNKCFPEQTNLEQRLGEAGAERRDEEFNSNGRPYNYKVWHWKSKRLAFEIPGQFSYLREQLDWGFAGLVTTQHIDGLLQEFGKGLKEHCRNKQQVATVDWDCRSDFSQESEAEVYFQKSQAGQLLQLLSDKLMPI